jgi:uncharacterized zinc-type alcohol dehydrogenase-like protein
MQLLACSRRFSLGYGIPNDMSEIRGFAGHATGAHLLPYRYEFGELLDDEVEVRISHCGVCHGDIRLIENDCGLSNYTFIPGHEIVGTISDVVTRVTDEVAGERVGIDWQAGSCGYL